MKISYGARFMGGMVAILVIALAVDIGNIVLANQTYDGLTTDHYYSHGLHYDQERAHRENPMGWHVALKAPEAKGPGRLEVSLASRAGVPLSGGTVSVELVRPTKAGFDQTVPLKEVAPGRFAGPVTMPMGGIWDADVHVRRGTERLDQLTRLHLKV